MEAAKAEWKLIEDRVKSDAQAEISTIQTLSKETILKTEEDHKQLVARIVRDANQAREEATAEMELLQTNTDAQIKEIMKACEEENEEKDAYAAKIKKDAEETQATMQNDFEVTISTLEAQQRADISRLQNQHDNKISDLQVEMANFKEKANSDLDTCKKETMTALEDAGKKAAKVLSTTKSTHTQAINDLTNAKISLENEVQSLDKRNKNLAKRLQYADKVRFVHIFMWPVKFISPFHRHLPIGRTCIGLDRTAI
jgi:murein DD-endopeptidase MepM/ murein hydrolase activator NlpD